MLITLRRVRGGIRRDSASYCSSDIFCESRLGDFRIKDFKLVYTVYTYLKPFVRVPAGWVRVVKGAMTAMKKESVPDPVPVWLDTRIFLEG